MRRKGASRREPRPRSRPPRLAAGPPGPRFQHVDDFFDRDDRARRGEHRLLLYPGDSPVLHVAGPVGLLRVDHGHVRPKRRHRRQPLSGKRAHDLGDVSLAGQAGAVVPAQHRERQPGRASHVAVGHPGVAVLLDLERPGPGVLDRVPEPVQRPDARVAAPGENQLARAPGADHLVVDHVRGHPDQREVTPPLPDHLACRGGRDQVAKAFHRHRVPVVHGCGDSLAK